MKDALYALLREAVASPTGREVLLNVAQQIVSGKSRYEDLHWGRRAHHVGVVEVPDVDPDDDEEPLVSLGPLAAIAYVTRKGRDPAPTAYLHEFSTPLPGLYADGDDLVIARNRSKYKINSHGIVG